MIPKWMIGTGLLINRRARVAEWRAHAIQTVQAKGKEKLDIWADVEVRPPGSVLISKFGNALFPEGSPG